jgi:uncharacterized protein YbaR (Trm112 family)
MFIELTDHLRCPEDHDEAYLVLLPDSVVQRSVQEGELGCPICHRTLHIRNGILDIGDGPLDQGTEPTLDGGSVAALTGLGGPGGYLVLAGPIAARWHDVEHVLNGVSMVAVNGPASLADERGISVLRSARLPLKSASMRGVVLSGEFGRDATWVREATRVLLPGLRVVGEGPLPDPSLLDVIASADGWWVGARRPAAPG